jgi:hypothetical protein
MHPRARLFDRSPELYKCGINLDINRNTFRKKIKELGSSGPFGDNGEEGREEE